MSEYSKKERAEELVPVIEEARELAEATGLSPLPCKFWVVDHEEMTELMSYGGFQERYPHWRWGMQYERNSINDRYGLGKAYELVINDYPAHAYLQEQNSDVVQKMVISHVMGHLDFFNKNPWFKDQPDAAAMLARHRQRIKEFMDDPDIGREAVEEWIDHVLCIEFNIDQYFRISRGTGEEEEKESDLVDRIDTLGLSEDVREQIFDEEWLTEQEDAFAQKTETTDLRKDVLGYLVENGRQFNQDAERSEEYEDWQSEVLEMIRKESYYFAPQMLTKVMNEGWAIFWQSVALTDEAFADVDEFVEYADFNSGILEDHGKLNPYALGYELWQYVENSANRDAVTEKLLRVTGVTPETFFDVVDFEKVQALITHPNHSEMAVRNFSLARPENKSFVKSTTRESLRDQYRYIMDTDQYSSFEEALSDLDYETGWRHMRDVRASHNDVTFLDEYLTEEFILAENYFTFDFSQARGRMEVSSRKARDVKRKLMMMFTNFGKPPVVVADGNYDNKGELLLAHKYSGITLNLPKASATLKRLFNLWGRPVHLYTLTKGDDDVEKPLHIMYDGNQLSTPETSMDEVQQYVSTDMSFKIETQP